MSKLNVAVRALSDALEALETRLDARLAGTPEADPGFEAEAQRAQALLEEAGAELDASIAALKALAASGGR